MAHANTDLWAASRPRPPRVAVVGVHGYGLNHLRALAPLVAAGRCELSAVVDQRPLTGEPAGLSGGASYFSSLEELLAADAPDVVVVATPIHTHLPLATSAMRAGCHVLLEKPPTASFAEFEALVAAAEEAGTACQVGFQSLGSDAYAAIDGVVAAGEIGEVRGIGAVGTWVRSTDYYDRAPWAGHRTLDGRDVVDGVVTNPLAHAVATALRIDGSTRADDVAALEVDLFRAHAIEADDTSAVRILTTRGTPMALGLTLCAAAQSSPRVIVHGSAGSLTFLYKEDTVLVEGNRGRRTITCSSTSLLENLLEHVSDPAVPLLSAVQDAGAFMRVQEAVRTAPDPRPIPDELVDWRRDEAGTHPVVHEVEHWCGRVAHELRTFTTLGAPWAPRHRTLASVRVAGAEVASYVDGAGTSALDSPRPHLHPVRTRGGVLVSDSAPDDHTWHAGVGVAVQDVGGNNLWGGRTYLPGRGYTWRNDHGRIQHQQWLARSEDHVSEELTWHDHDGTVLLREHRDIRWAPLGDHWELELAFTLTNDTDGPLALGSPGSNGRERGGYGGFFWRLPACQEVQVRTDRAEGEEAVHGTQAPWLAWSARTAEGPFTVVLEPASSEAAADPWFVRVSGYPGLGSALAWDTAVDLGPQQRTHRAFRAVVADGHLDDEEVARLAARPAGAPLSRSGS